MSAPSVSTVKPTPATPSDVSRRYTENLDGQNDAWILRMPCSRSAQRSLS